jgi:hypothetical protein
LGLSCTVQIKRDDLNKEHTKSTTNFASIRDCKIIDLCMFETLPQFDLFSQFLNEFSQSPKIVKNSPNPEKPVPSPGLM